VLILNCLVNQFGSLSHHRELQTVAKRHLAIRVENRRINLRKRRLVRSLPKPFANPAAGPNGIEQIPWSRLEQAYSLD
jgi:hypothetical protein